jgi:hypothetical protein
VLLVKLVYFSMLKWYIFRLTKTNVAAEKAAEGLPIIREGVKHRFLWVLAPKGTLEYAAWRRALPRWVREPEWGENGLGWTQPRLLIQPMAG